MAKLAPRLEHDPINDIARPHTVSKIERNLEDEVGHFWRNERKQERTTSHRRQHHDASS